MTQTVIHMAEYFCSLTRYPSFPS